MFLLRQHLKLKMWTKYPVIEVNMGEHYSCERRSLATTKFRYKGCETLMSNSKYNAEM